MEDKIKAAAAKFGLRYDGIQEELGYQLTDESVTGSTFYVKHPDQIEPNLMEMRQRFGKGGSESLEIKISDEHHARFQEHVRRVVSTRSFELLTPWERGDMARYLDLWLLQQEVM